MGVETIAAGTREMGQLLICAGLVGGGVATASRKSAGDAQLVTLGTVTAATATIAGGRKLAERDGVPLLQWFVDSDEVVRSASRVRSTPAAVRLGLYAGSAALLGAAIGSTLMLSGGAGRGFAG